jgi:MbtH protein
MFDSEKPLLDDLTIDGDVFAVLVNEEGQYSLWPAGKAVPEGWSRVGPTGTKAECLAFVEANWTDMRPRSLQTAMEQDQNS